MESRLLAIMGGSATLVGMYGVIYFTGQRIAAEQMAQIAEQEKAQGYKKTNSVKNLDHIELTPWVNIPLKTPLMLLSSFFGAAAAKAITHPDSVPLSELLYATPQTLYGVGLGIFGVSAYFYRVSVKYMVKIGTPVPNGYQVKTLCTHGPFQYFQHPIYCALFGCSLATPLVLDSAWSFVSPLAFWAYVNFLVVPRENKYMQDKFGAEHQRFCDRFSFNPLLFQ
eukprot:Tamp_18161.p1 GENE.Tamp_18161~~Tamp_18161.p1  ORF type:complete len:248 (-),score=52.33 Tamp_18161:598-1269(-)